MKKEKFLKSAVHMLLGIALVMVFYQCTQDGVNVSKLDRAFAGTPDSTHFSPFYDSVTISSSGVSPDVNDIIAARGVQRVVKEYCGVSTCHGGPVSPKLSTYSEIRKYAVAGEPLQSKLWNQVTTNDMDAAMPPVSAGHELSISDKTILYNWIKNGAKELPGIQDYRPAAVKLIATGCTSANCHSAATVVGAWAESGLLSGIGPSDTSRFALVRSSGIRYYTIMNNTTILNKVWNDYKDSVRMYYKDTLANASWRPYKTFSTPVVKASVRGSLSSYDDLLLDILYPKALRSVTSVTYTAPNGAKYYVRSNPLNSTSSLISRIDSTIVLANPATGVFATNHQGDMAFDDGGLNPSEIALIKAWYFEDTNVPNTWKYGATNNGIFKYRKSGYIIKSK